MKQKKKHSLRHCDRPSVCWSLRFGTLYFFYKHLVYKHAQPQILGKFKHIAKHAPG